MYAKRLFASLLLGTSVLSGCAVRHYQPAPITPTESASRLESRSLADAGLHSFIEENLGHRLAAWPPEAWDLNTLSLAALYFSSAFDSVRARVMEAQAAVVTAGGRPNPTLSVAPGIPSPYLFNLDFAVPVETAGKRGHRLQSARSFEHAARFELADAAWKLHSAV
ncbi:MAG: TolC family protein, partial [Acidobacteria bacterium]|nr:TolC family protein [Acidobacteriota bacterium]